MKGLASSPHDEHAWPRTCTGARTSTSTSYRARARRAPARVRHVVLVLVLAPVHVPRTPCPSLDPVDRQQDRRKSRQVGVRDVDNRRIFTDKSSWLDKHLDQQNK